MYLKILSQFDILFIDPLTGILCPEPSKSPMAALPSRSPPEPDRDVAVARYIASMSGDLARLARGNGFQTLGYLLEIAQLEAEQAVGQTRR
ncbi:MAG: hypothetical protein J0H78_00320 [Rhizobiales bacterium]|nr:hypothetical protein [Hyphomicrobiales bacterium]